ncbi:MAG TPA: tyrosine-type recombinase/integrase [Candidatus Acidoferrum sp.]|jgi:integrase
MATFNVENSGPQSMDSFKTYLESYLATGKGPAGPWRAITKASYTRDYKAIKPFIPDTLKLKDVDTPAVNRILQALYEDDGDDLRAQSAYNNIKTFLSTAMRMAVGSGLVKVNPVPDAFPLKGKDADTHAYTLDEVYVLAKAANNPTMEAAFIVAAFTGMRMEEIKGLRWEDYKNGILEVKRTVAHGVVDDPKSAASKAPVPVVGVVKQALAKLLKQNRGDGYIFHAEHDPQTPAIFENLLRRDVFDNLEKAGVEWHGMHAFRRGLATVLHSIDGVGDRTIDHVLRHESKKDDVAGKHYIKPDMKQIRRVLEQVEKMYKAVEKKNKRRKR